MPITPQRNVRIPDDEWKRFAAACEANATTPSTVIRQAVRAYLQEMAALNRRGLVLEDQRRYNAHPHHDQQQRTVGCVSRNRQGSSAW